VTVRRLKKVPSPGHFFEFCGPADLHGSPTLNDHSSLFASGTSLSNGIKYDLTPREDLNSLVNRKEHLRRTEKKEEPGPEW
jgi:hypothetical protein